jgi:hypothetical protein
MSLRIQENLTLSILTIADWTLVVQLLISVEPGKLMRGIVVTSLNAHLYSSSKLTPRHANFEKIAA